MQPSPDASGSSAAVREPGGEQAAAALAVDAEDEHAALATVLEQLLGFVRRIATAGGLSWPAAAVLTRLLREGAQRSTDLAGAEGVSQPAMSQLIARLERDGYVVRRAAPEDRRAVVVEATAAAADVVRRRRSQRSDAVRDLLDRLDPADRAALRAAVPALAHLVALSSPSPAGSLPVGSFGENR